LDLKNSLGCFFPNFMFYWGSVPSCLKLSLGRLLAHGSSYSIFSLAFLCTLLGSPALSSSKMGLGTGSCRAPIFLHIINSSADIG